MSRTVVTTDSWLSRLMKSIVSVGGGAGLFLMSFLVLFFNEGRAVQTEKSLNEGAGSVKTVPADKVNPAFESKLVHLSGEAKTTETLSDPEFKVSANAIKLDRHVEMYQWQEHSHTEERKRAGGAVDKITTYTYDKDWSSTAIDSASFNESDVYENPPMPYSSQQWVASKVTVGAFTLSPDLVGKYNESEDLPVTAPQAKALPKAMHAQLENTSFYVGDSAATPQVGDVRVSYRVVKPGAVSVVAVQKGETFTPWAAPSGDDLLLLQAGTHTSAEMFVQAQSDNNTMTLILRVIGWAMMFIGLRMVFKPLVVMADVVPLVGTALNAGLGVFSFALASGLSTIVLGVSWLFFRPLSGIALLAVGGGALFALFRYAKSKRAAKGTIDGAVAA